MQIHQLKPPHYLKRRKRIGRGGKKGTYSGKGMKGQRSRAGAKIRPQLRDFIMKIPKKRGSRFILKREKFTEVKWRRIKKTFPQGGLISPASLKKAKLLKGTKRKKLFVKIIGEGNLSAPYIIKNCFITEKAKEVILKAGGKVEKK